LLKDVNPTTEGFEGIVEFGAKSYAKLIELLLHHNKR
jgi:hypothetical protein